jgi:hypothetical protein
MRLLPLPEVWEKVREAALTAELEVVEPTVTPGGE